MAEHINLPDPLAGMDLTQPVKVSLHTGLPAALAEPVVWPACVKCGTAWSLHRRLVTDPGPNLQPYPVSAYRWVWFRSCGHHSAPWTLVNENGAVDTG